MSNIEGIFSLRLVIVDFYMEKPTFSLDPCYSEFRGKEIKKVPILRIFGANGLGQKTCMHVHGVFPYFYIPYEHKDFESLNKAVYQIATNLDKALNISLGQGSSGAQHVFKVQLVKGVPFYGYHRREHQFLKIYMFNPRFVRRAANLMQNGAILGKNFHPHESHVPYILQFMIDYNLYGMSMLHVPLEVVKFRRTSDEEAISFSGIQTAQILSAQVVRRQSISALEVDISSNFILNRFQLVNKTNSTHTNPGIASIWQDERLRRQKLATTMMHDKLSELPALAVPPIEQRPHAQPAESELFYRSALLAKLLVMETSMLGSQAMDQTVNSTLQTTLQHNSLADATFGNNQSLATNDKAQKRTFNLKKILANAVYPEECTQHDMLTNASFIENHLSSSGNSALHDMLTEATLSTSSAAAAVDESAYLDDTIVDEELVLSLTQQHVPLNASLREEDFQLLDILEQLEVDDDNHEHIDLDSSLAPLSQNHKNFELSPKQLDKETVAQATNHMATDASDTDSENDAHEVHDFSMVMDNIDDILLKLSQSQATATTATETNRTLPQIDGTDDLLRTPTKTQTDTKRTTSANAKLQQTPPRTPKTPQSRRFSVAGNTPTRSPRTPKSVRLSRYAPLPLIITSKSAKKNLLDNNNVLITPTKAATSSTAVGCSLQKTVALSEIRRKTISAASDLSTPQQDLPIFQENSKIVTRRSRRIRDLDKTHITCALSPRPSSERKLKVYSAESREEIPNLESIAVVTKSSEETDFMAETILESNITENRKSGSKMLTKMPAKDVTNAKHAEVCVGTKMPDINVANDASSIVTDHIEVTEDDCVVNDLNMHKVQGKLNTGNIKNTIDCSRKDETEHVEADFMAETLLESNITKKRRSGRKVISEKNSKVLVDKKLAESNMAKSRTKLLGPLNIVGDHIELTADDLATINDVNKNEIQRNIDTGNIKTAIECSRKNETGNEEADFMAETLLENNAIEKRRSGRKVISNIPEKYLSKIKNVKVLVKKTDKAVIKSKIDKHEAPQNIMTDHIAVNEMNKNLVQENDSIDTENVNSGIKCFGKHGTGNEEIENKETGNEIENGKTGNDGIRNKQIENKYTGSEDHGHNKITIEDNNKNTKNDDIKKQNSGNEEAGNKPCIVETRYKNTEKHTVQITVENTKHEETTDMDNEEPRNNTIPSNVTGGLETGNDMHNDENISEKDMSDHPRYEINTEATKLLPSSTESQVEKSFGKLESSKFSNSEKCDSKTSDSNDEIIDSDTDVDIMPRRTPNLKRLRRSFIARSAKRRCLSNKLTVALAEHNSTSGEKSIIPETTKTDATIPFVRANFAASLEEAKNPMSPALITFEKSYAQLNSPSVFSQISGASPAHLSASPCVMPTISEANNSPITSSTSVRITPLDLPPTYEEVLAGCRKFNITEFEFQEPFYNNPADITHKKEIGYTVLSIPGNKLNDCPEFRSVLGADLKGLNEWRKQELLKLGGPVMLNRYRNTERVREYFATQKSVLITPLQEAPSRHDAKLWLKARELLSNKNDAAPAHLYGLDEDSPIKVSRKKVTMMLNEGGGAGDGDADEDMDCSSRSLALTPMTPSSPCRRQDATSSAQCQSGNSGTPLTTQLTQPRTSISGRRRQLLGRSRVSLLEKLKATPSNLTKAESTDEVTKIKCVQSHLLLQSGSSTDDAIPPSPEHVKDSQSSNASASSEAVLAELERSSFIKQLQLPASAEHDLSFGLSSATLNNTFGFKVNLENLQQAKADIEYNYLTTLMLEVFVRTRDELYPDPVQDQIRCIFYAIDNSIPTQTLPETPDAKQLPTKACGYIIVNDESDVITKEGRRHGIDVDVAVQVVTTEVDALQALLDLCAVWDPDIYAGYEIEMGSWGYIIERAKYLNMNICAQLSRMPAQKVREFVDEDREQFTDLDVEMKLCGRILLDVWRLMRSEIALTSYTFENVMYHILHRRCPWHSHRQLTMWFLSPCTRWIVIEYYLERVRGTLALLDQLDLIGRTSEMAKLIGIQFYEVLSRGSQFRVESMMLRIAKPKNLVPLSPSVQQRAHMRAPEYLALIMEPLSRFYADPLIVLDFQSLYPSMIIAYNYCFSTCLGRVEHLGKTEPFEFGASQLRVSPQLLRKLLDRELVTISPCGVVFVKSQVREGILPRMLCEILDTRQMVKQSMKLHKSNSALQRILHSRQLGLKLMANVTYGYTAANFSGRMPSVEVGDTVVSKGRETLERAIKMVETNDKWNVKVVYGDTDSMFVLVPGRSRAKAFEIGAEIAEAVTQANPHPVKLKLEKVYQPCILQTKKRYVGYMYETPDQAEPVYEAKGIETVRRDGCPAVAKMLEKVLRILFETADVSKVKQYVCRQFTKLLSGRANLQDLIFAKEFRGLNGYKPTACVPALELTRKWLQSDPRHIPRRGERVPFIITNGPPGVPLIRLVRSPHEVLADEGLKINAIYYITKAIIPPLNRCLLLIGADVNDWFTNLPRKILTTPALSMANELIANSTTSAATMHSKKSTISQYFSTTNCIIDCGRQTKAGICSACECNAAKAVSVLHTKIGRIERAFHLTQQICQACCGRVGDIKCDSLDCPVLYVVEVKRRDMQQIGHFYNLLEERFEA